MMVAWFVPGFLANYLWIGLKLEWMAAILIGLYVLASPWVFRLSRSAWLHHFVKHDPTIRQN